MDGSIYRREFASRGIKTEVPNEAGCTLVNDTIDAELVHGIFTSESRNGLENVIRELQATGCDAVALICTEIPLLTSDADTRLPTLDSIALLAKAALDASLRRRSAPSWRGGRYGARADRS